MRSFFSWNLSSRMMSANGGGGGWDLLFPVLLPHPVSFLSKFVSRPKRIWPLPSSSLSFPGSAPPTNTHKSTLRPLSTVMPSKSTKVQTSAPPEKRKREEAAPAAAASVEPVKKTRVAEDDDEPAATAAPAGGAEARKKTGAEKKREKKARERAEKDKERAIEAARPTQGVPSALAPLSVAGVPAAEGGEPLPKKARTTGGASAAAGGEAGEMDAENEEGEEVEEDEDKGHSEPAEPLPTKEEIEADKDLEKSEGAKLGEIYAMRCCAYLPIFD